MSIPMRERVRPDFPAVVHTYTDALRVLREAPDNALTAAELAAKTERDPSNVRRDLQKLRDAGVVAFVGGDDRAHLAEKGRRWLQGQDVAEGAAAPPGDDGVLRLRHDQLRPDPDQPRKTFEVGALEELRQDLVTHGQLQNLLVRPDPDDAGKYLILGGERRWRAIGDAIADDDWPEDKPLLCVLRDDDTATKRLLVQLSENLQRRALSPIEEARAFQVLVDAGVGTDDLADRVHVSRRQVQLRLQLLELSPKDQTRMELPADDPQHLSVTEARRILQQPKAPEPEPIPAEDLLVFAEIADRIVHQPRTNAWQETECSPYVGGEQVERLSNKFGYGGELGFQRQHWRDGRTYVQLSYRANQALASRGLDIQGEARAEKLAELRRQVIGVEGAARLAQGERYATEWLNGPWDLTPEANAAMDVAAAQRAEQEAAFAQRRKEAEAQAARHRTVDRTAREFIQHVHQTSRSGQMANLRQLLEAAERPLPWRWNWEEGNWQDANGNFVDLYETPESVSALIAVALNLAAGIPVDQWPDLRPPPEEEEAEPDDEDESEEEPVHDAA